MQASDIAVHVHIGPERGAFVSTTDLGMKPPAGNGDASVLAMSASNFVLFQRGINSISFRLPS